jgi:hypothetical protein
MCKPGEDAERLGHEFRIVENTSHFERSLDELYSATRLESDLSCQQGGHQVTGDEDTASLKGGRHAL